MLFDRFIELKHLLRFFAFRYRLSDYRGDLKGFLDRSLRDFNGQFQTVEEFKNEAKLALAELSSANQLTRSIFGEEAFTSFKSGKSERRFNRAVFDVMIFFFTNPEIREAVQTRELQTAVSDEFKKLCDEQEFARWIQTTTKSKEATFGRLRTWGECLEKLTGMQLTDTLLET